MHKLIEGSGLKVKKIAGNGLRAIVVMCLPLLVFGCGSLQNQKTVHWSPDGSKAIVRASDGVRLTDKDGNLSDMLLEDPAAIGWGPDNNSLVVGAKQEIQSYEELRAKLPEGAQEKIELASTYFAGLAVKYGKAASMEKLTKIEQAKVDELLKNARVQDVVAHLYFSDRKSYDTLFKKADKKEDKYFPSINAIKSFKVSDSKLILDAMLYKTAAELKQIAVSPNNRVIAFIESEIYKEDESYTLKLLNKKNKDVMVVARRVKPNISWFEKSGKIVFIQESGDGENNYGYLNWARVFKENGSMLDKPEVTKLATIGLNGDNNNLVCTKDGRIFFSSSVRSLPKLGYDEPSSQSLFVMEPLRMAAVTKVLAAEIESIDCKYLDVSQDGNKVCILDKSGKVILFDLKAGDRKEVQSKTVTEDDFDRAFICPQFRTTGDLCFSIPKKAQSQEDRIAEIVLYDVKSEKQKLLSGDWPKKAVEFLYKPKQKQAKKEQGSK